MEFVGTKHFWDEAFLAVSRNDVSAEGDANPTSISILAAGGSGSVKPRRPSLSDWYRIIGSEDMLPGEDSDNEVDNELSELDRLDSNEEAADLRDVPVQPAIIEDDCAARLSQAASATSDTEASLYPESESSEQSEFSESGAAAKDSDDHSELDQPKQAPSSECNEFSEGGAAAQHPDDDSKFEQPEQEFPVRTGSMIVGTDDPDNDSELEDEKQDEFPVNFLGARTFHAGISADPRAPRSFHSAQTAPDADLKRDYNAKECSKCGKRMGYFMALRGLGLRERWHEATCTGNKPQRSVFSTSYVPQAVFV